MSENTMERGTPSQGLADALKGAKTTAEGGILDESPGYEPLTTGAPERGVFQLVGGYLETFTDGRPPVLHNEVELRAMTGHEEDLLSNDSIPFFRRMTSILAQCCKRIGTLTDRADIVRAIHGLPAGSRAHLLVCLRRTSHFRATKDIYDMVVECPKCGKDSTHRVNLAQLERYEMPDATKREYREVLPESNHEVIWRITQAPEDEILSAVVKHEQAQHELLTWSILIRVKSVNGQVVEVKPGDIVDPDKGDLLKPLPGRILELRQMIKNWPSGDRQFLRDRFMEHEPGIDVDVDFTCTNTKCKKEFAGRLDLGQRGFFFPSGKRTRSNRRSFT